ncbi:MAG: SH3 domain-containing protein [Acidobacteriota bacterium]|nr:SH3 domain-containing protein [Acidobacteriota bacterium]
MSVFSNCGQTKLSLFFLLAGLLLASACSGSSLSSESAYVVPEKIRLKNSTAQAARGIGELKSGDRVTITERSKSEDGTPWVNVKAADGQEGWAEAKNFIKEDIVAKSRKMADEIKDIPTQAIGKSKATLKLRLTPDRTTEENVAAPLPSGTIMEIVARERKPRPASLDQKAESAEGAASDSKQETKYDEWLQVRLSGLTVLPAGWIYGGSVELDIPGEIIYFVSSGRRIVGWQKLGTVHGDDSRTGDHFLVLERKVIDADDRADFDRIKVLAYDAPTRNYTTPFKDDVIGRFPISVKMDGQSGSFRAIVLDKNDAKQEIEYSVEIMNNKVKAAKPAAQKMDKK